MKHFWILVLLMLPLTALKAQSADEVVSGSGDIEFDRNVSVSQPVRQTPANLQEGHEYSHLFVEGLLAYESYGSLGAGATVAYLPEWIGGYASATAYNSHSMYTFGPAIRPLANIASLDWQVFCGLAYAAPITRYFNNRLGFEIGTRFAPNADSDGDRFAWWSVSLSRLFVNQHSYFTIGLSVNLIALTGIILIP